MRGEIQSQCDEESKKYILDFYENKDKWPEDDSLVIGCVNSSFGADAENIFKEPKVLIDLTSDKTVVVVVVALV